MCIAIWEVRRYKGGSSGMQVAYISYYTQAHVWTRYLRKSVALRQQNASFEVRRNGVAANFDHISDIVEVLLKMIFRCGFLSLFRISFLTESNLFLSSSLQKMFLQSVSGLVIILIFPNPVIASRESLCNICNCGSDLKRIECGIGITKSTFLRFNFCLGNVHLLCHALLFIFQYPLLHLL